MNLVLQQRSPSVKTSYINHIRPSCIRNRNFTVPDTYKRQFLDTL